MGKVNIKEIRECCYTDVPVDHSERHIGVCTDKESGLVHLGKTMGIITKNLVCFNKRCIEKTEASQTYFINNQSGQDSVEARFDIQTVTSMAALHFMMQVMSY